jgi:Glycosyl hydrolase family 47
MIEKNKLVTSLTANLNWLEKSGVLNPVDGSWGIAARLVVTEGNTALEHTKKSFPSYTKHDGYIIVEHRRTDCNFEAALLFLEAANVMNEPEYYKKADNILRYLFCRSGMYNTKYDKYPKNVWRWANEKWEPAVWFDDNSWNCAISLIIAERYPELDKKYNIKNKALLLADQLLTGFNAQFQQEELESWDWHGDLNLPHWGALVVMALAYAYRINPKTEYREAVIWYHKYLLSDEVNFNASDQAYALIGSATAAAVIRDENVKLCAVKYADLLLNKMDYNSGSIPSEHGKEAPIGEHLVDMIYTQNWAVVGLHTLYQLTGDEKYSHGLNKAMKLIIDIQDKNPQSHFNGCWRGMFDLKTNKWGGGNLYEGGADSIYTGWTNIPVSWTIAFMLSGRSLLLDNKKSEEGISIDKIKEVDIKNKNIEALFAV